MTISKGDREDVLTAVAIELQRMFTVLSNVYEAPELHDRSLFLEEIQTAIHQSIESLSHART